MDQLKNFADFTGIFEIDKVYYLYTCFKRQIFHYVRTYFVKRKILNNIVSKLKILKNNENEILFAIVTMELAKIVDGHVNAMGKVNRAKKSIAFGL